MMTMIIYVVRNFVKDYPELIPRNLDSLKENDLINLSKHNNMDIEKSTKSP